MPNGLCICVFKVCYVLDAFLSPYVLLSSFGADSVSESSSARCIVMSVFLHYFFLTQITAVIVQVSTNHCRHCTGEHKSLYR